MRTVSTDIEQRISRITDSERTMVDIYKGVKSSKATREMSMEVVAWIAVCKFQCKLEGGFVRDWVVAGNHKRPAGLEQDPKAWIQYETSQNGQSVPSIHKGVVPGDLDCHLPLNMYFNIEKFRDELHRYDITCKVIWDHWRYLLLIDEDAPTGPFTMDLIEPHVALTHDRMDFDVNNLSLEKDYPHEIGMRVDTTQSPYLIQLETIIENIKQKRFRVLRPIDNGIKRRIEKMISRNWIQTGEPIDYIPRPHQKHYALLVPLPSTSTLYLTLSENMLIKGSQAQILSIEEVKNPLLEDAYESMKNIIAKECPNHNPNEQKLFHGIEGDEATKSIVEDGFDDRFFSSHGSWGKCTCAQTCLNLIF